MIGSTRVPASNVNRHHPQGIPLGGEACGLENTLWMPIVWRTNELAEEAGEAQVFGKPTEIGPWWAGGEVEEYDEARIIFRTDPTVSIVAKTARAAKWLKQADEDVHANIHPVLGVCTLYNKQTVETPA